MVSELWEGGKHYISVIIAAALLDNENTSDYQQQCSFSVYIIYLLSKLHTSGFPDLLRRYMCVYLQREKLKSVTPVPRAAFIRGSGKRYVHQFSSF